ncbi:MAG: GNAT family N-acetyltransferase [Saccharofermentanales bacterium]
MCYELKSFDESDASDISALICRNFNEVSIRDYPAEEIRLLCERHTKEHILRLSRERVFLVAFDAGLIVGAAALLEGPDGFPPGYGLVTTVFVLPEYHGKGVGKLLMESIECMARESGIEVLALESSITAHGFYHTLGFTDEVCTARKVADDLFYMEKLLGK